MNAFGKALIVSAAIMTSHAALAEDGKHEFYRIEGHLGKAVRAGALVQLCDTDKLKAMVEAKTSLRKLGDHCFKFGEKAEPGYKTPGVYVEEIVKFPPS